MRWKNLIGQFGIFLLGFCGSLYVALTPANSMMNWYSIDDAFYYYKVAQNVIGGYGFTFDQINLSNGFHPLWMIVCLCVFGLSKQNLLLPLRVLILVSGAFNGLTGVFLFRLLKKFLHPAAAVLGAVVWMLLPSVYNTTAVHGMEAILSAFFLVLFLLQSVNIIQSEHQSRSKRITSLLIAGLLAALFILSRLDNVFVAFTIGMFLILRVQRMNRLLVFDLVAILIAAVCSWIVRFGTTPSALNAYSMYPMLLIGLLIKPVILYFMGFYSPTIKDSLFKFILRLGISGLAFLVLEYILQRLLQSLGFNLLLSRSVIFIDAAITTILIGLLRLFFFQKQSATQTPPSPWRLFFNWVKNDLGRIITDGLIFAAPVVILIGTYMGINKVIFGIYTPVSGQIKAWWGVLSNTVYATTTTLVDLLGMSPSSGNGPWSLLTSLIAKTSIGITKIFEPGANELPTRLFLTLNLLVFILLVFLLSRKDGLLARKSFSLLVPALIIGCFLHITNYTARSYAHTRFWYWIIESFVLVILGAIFSSYFFEKIKKWTKTEVPNRILLMLGILLVLFLHTRFILNLSPQVVAPENEANYLQTARELEKYTDEGSLIGMTGGGTTAYFIENRTIVNLDGLINSAEYFQALKTGTAGDFLDRLPLDYVYGKPYILFDTEPYGQIFTTRLKEIGYIHGGDAFTLFRYISSR